MNRTQQKEWTGLQYNQKFKVDSISEKFCLFVESSEESRVLMLPICMCPINLKEGDVVYIKKQDSKYIITVSDQMKITPEKINVLLAKMESIR